MKSYNSRCKVDSKGRYIPSAKEERADYDSLSYAGQKSYNDAASEDRHPKTYSKKRGDNDAK